MFGQNVQTNCPDEMLRQHVQEASSANMFKRHVQAACLECPGEMFRQNVPAKWECSCQMFRPKAHDADSELLRPATLTSGGNVFDANHKLPQIVTHSSSFHAAFRRLPTWKFQVFHSKCSKCSLRSVPSVFQTSAGDRLDGLVLTISRNDNSV